MISDTRNSSDINHCRCFKIDPKDIELCKEKLVALGFEAQIIEENHGQVFGLKHKLLELLQIHFKVMPNGVIESELEPPATYPGAHLNKKHSFSSHYGIPILLTSIGIKYEVIPPIPETCLHPEIINPTGPLKWWEMIILGLIAAGIGYLVLQSFKK